MAVADASFKTVIDTISFGLIVARALGTPAISEFDRGIPSITINGSLLAFNEAPPRILIVLPEPGAPSFGVIDTPATLPRINCSGVTIAPLLKSFALIAVTAPVRSFFILVPYPITTTSDSEEVAPHNENF